MFIYKVMKIFSESKFEFSERYKIKILDKLLEHQEVYLDYSWRDIRIDLKESSIITDNYKYIIDRRIKNSIKLYEITPSKLWDEKPGFRRD